MSRIFVASDHHFGHPNILNFKREDGSLIRGAVFKNSHEHDEVIIAKHNAVVLPQDHVYFLGDVAINRRFLPLVTRMMGHKRLVRGNHDIARTKEYLDNGFDEIYGVRVFRPQDQQGKTGFILSHIPLHPRSVPKWARNVHGHTHANIVRDDNGHPDPRYICVSLEHTDYAPVLLMDL
jgi:calcineurin-like phosphoesterase family protein